MRNIRSIHRSIYIDIDIDIYINILEERAGQSRRDLCEVDLPDGWICAKRTLHLRAHETDNRDVIDFSLRL